MKNLKLWLVMIGAFAFLVACEADPVTGSGSLPERGEELVANYIKDVKGDESGGRIVYVKDAAAEQSEEKKWCIQVRYVNRSGVVTKPMIVTKNGDEWSYNASPDREIYEGYGCTWPKNSE